MVDKVGIGYDIHRLVKGRKLFLGGVEIAYAKGLLGHSDGDVLLHALCDALLGASGSGDIGKIFPDTDPKYKDISSTLLLKKTSALLKKKGLRLTNIDSIIIAARPRLEQFKQKISENIAKALGIDKRLINIKAKTNDGLGPEGRLEAISAYVVAGLATRSIK